MKTPWLEHYKTLGINVPDLNDQPLGAFLEQHASERPDNAALWYIARAISYGELHQQVNRFANALSVAGIGKGDVVGIHLPNIPQYIIALGAISKLGAIGSGVSPLLAPPELAYQINDAQMKAVLTLNDFSAAFSAMTTVPDCLEAVIIASAKDLLAPENFDLLHIAVSYTHLTLPTTSRV